MQVLKQKLAALDAAEYEGGAMPRIHVSLGQLAASSPAARHETAVAGD
jgi:hypothetical protein